MWTRLLKSTFLLGLFLIAARSFAVEHLSLVELRQKVLNENYDIRIQYEKYYQAQRGVAVARGQFLPGANISLININATLAVLQSVVPTPSEWFVYRASQELNTAEKFTTESIKLNILEGLTINYVSLKHQENLMKSLREEEGFLLAIYNETRANEDLGQATASEVFMAKRNLLQHQQDIFALESLMVAEKQAMLIALNKNPDEELVLADLPAVEDRIPGDISEATALALKNSTELLSNSYQIQAARNMVQSARWSFLSFNGIGFDYSATLSIERSKERVIELKSEQIGLKIKNQVHSAYKELEILDQRIVVQLRVLETTREMERRSGQLYSAHLIPLSDFVSAKKYTKSEERTLLKLQMERRVKYAQIQRLLSLDATLNNVDLSLYESLIFVKEESSNRRNTKVWLKINGDENLMNDIYSVTYEIEGKEPVQRVLQKDSQFSYFIKLREAGTYQILAKIQLLSGDIIERSDVISVE